MEPVPARALERAVVAIQGYLRGEEVEFDGVRSEIRWLVASEQPKVPVAVAATGPRVIELGARHADQLDLTVGAEHDRLAWAIDIARAASEGGAALGAFINVAVHPDRAVARDLVRGSAAIFARFATEGAPPDGLSAVTRRGIQGLAADYDEARHGQASAAYARALEDDFIDRFAIAGPPDDVTERLKALGGLGLQRVIVVPGSLDADADLLERSNELFAAEVLPAL